MSLVLESAEDVIQVAEHLEGGTRCAIRSLYVQGNERVPTEAWQQLSCRLPPSVKRVCLSDFGGAEVYVARALPRSVEALTIRGGRGWTPMEREMLLERRELHELTIDGASAGAFVEWANDIATTGRACGVENLCLSRGWIGSHGARDVLTAIRTLVAADTNLMHLQVAGFENVFPAPTLANDQKLAAKMEKNHTLQTIGGVDLPVGVPALLDRNRRALNMAMKVGSNALSQWVEREDRGGTMVETGKCEDQPGGAVLGVVINHIDQKSSDSRDFRNVIRTTFQASSAAEKAAKDIFYPEKK